MLTVALSRRATSSAPFRSGRVRESPSSQSGDLETNLCVATSRSTRFRLPHAQTLDALLPIVPERTVLADG